MYLDNHIVIHSGGAQELNNNLQSFVVAYNLFDNTLTSNGTGFSFQLGTIYKVTPELRIGFTYDSPTWMTIEEETTQYLETHVLDDVNGDFYQIVDPNIINVFAYFWLCNSIHSKVHRCR